MWHTCIITVVVQGQLLSASDDQWLMVAGQLQTRFESSFNSTWMCRYHYISPLLYWSYLASKAKNFFTSDSNRTVIYLVFQLTWTLMCPLYIIYIFTYVMYTFIVNNLIWRRWFCDHWLISFSWKIPSISPRYHRGNYPRLGTRQLKVEVWMRSWFNTRVTAHRRSALRLLH